MRISKFLQQAKRSLNIQAMLISTTFWVLLVHLLLLLTVLLTFTRPEPTAIIVSLQADNTQAIRLQPTLPRPAKKPIVKTSHKPQVAKRQRIKAARAKQAQRRRAQLLLKKQRQQLARKRTLAAKAAKAAKAARIAKLKRQALKLQQKLLQQQQAREAARVAASIKSARQALLNKYTGRIIAQISQNWLVPPGVARTLQCTLAIHLAPGGVVLSVNLAKSSGNSVLDSSAIAAVYKASPLPVPKGGDFSMFRQIQLIVQPLQRT